MRKEVKLGMTLGGGAVALLVGYLLVAPPSNKKGTQLVGSGGGSIIDNSQPGDLSAGSGGEDRGAAAKPDAAQGAPANNGGVTGNVEQPQQPKPPVDQPPAKVEEKPVQGKTGGDKWTVLNSGKVAKPAAPGDSQATHHENTPIENRLTARRGGSDRVEGSGGGAVAEARAAAPRPRQEARLYFNPSGAWGDGLSTDGIAAHGGVGRGGAKATVVEASADSPKAGGTHVVKSGETFSSIAAAVYGSAAYYPHLVRANPQANPNNLKLGTVINIPPLDQVKATGGSKGEGGVGAPAVAQDAKLDPTRQYKVQSGDSLYKISVKVYGKSTYVDRIYEANKAAIGPNPTKLKLGMVLELPEKAGTIASTTAGNDQPIGDAQSGPENDGK